MQRSALWLMLLLPWLMSGCTVMLWQENSLDAYNKSATDPHLRLYNAKEKQDLLALYDEFSERDGTRITRAYFLYQNNWRVENARPPWFVSTNLAKDFPPLPVLASPPMADTNSPEELYAVLGTNCTSFTLYSGPRVVSSHSLPHYADGVGDFERVLLTPLAVGVDVTVVGGLLLLVAVCSDHDSDNDFNYDPPPPHPHPHPH